MREYKFRGKRIDNSKWVYGYLIANTSHNSAWIKDISDKYTNPRVIADNYADFRCITVDHNTVGQFTGLPDKNGTEIYEGDRLRLTDYHGERTVYVKFYNGFYYYTGDGFSDEYLINSHDREVIGNIHDNEV